MFLMLKFLTCLIFFFFFNDCVIDHCFIASKCKLELHKMQESKLQLVPSLHRLSCLRTNSKRAPCRYRGARWRCFNTPHPKMTTVFRIKRCKHGVGPPRSLGQAVAPQQRPYITTIYIPHRVFSFKRRLNFRLSRSYCKVNNLLSGRFT